ncbi:MAG TPA: hypothetical protein VK421_08950 [Pyrinomonadaceae bacterium]|nr:hypothetical protein [Pyrinomonadaceae bacterium]
MTDDELQLNAQRSLQEFDDARDRPDTDIRELGRKAVGDLDSFIGYWREKPYMQDADFDASEGGHGELREYAERQIEWAEEERARVTKLLTPPSAEG